MRFWWVNQNQTYKAEVAGEFLWSPKTKKDGAKNEFYDNMRRVSPGDLVFSFCDTKIKALGLVTSLAESAPKPNFGAVGTNWSDDGWLVRMSYAELKSSIRPKDHISLLREHLPAKYSPLQASGDGLQSVYLAAVPDSMAAVLCELLEPEYSQVLRKLKGIIQEGDPSDSTQEEAIRGRTDIGETAKSQLIKARRGQGVFRANVQLNERGCRITGVTESQHLRASHIKPWRVSNDEEKLNGCNGLLLAPHVDHLFDRGLISFTDDGQMILSPRLEKDLIAKWGIPENAYVGPFNHEQSRFLEYHRNHVLQAAAQTGTK